jgi:chemotaxis protein methyltransferase CheR/type IV pilus assembly protein PilK
MSWEKVSFPVLTDAQFLMWQDLLEERTGMYVAKERQSLLQSNLIIRMREIDCLDFDEYYAHVCTKPSGIVEWNVLLDRLMVQETRFYRDPESLILFQEFLMACLQGDTKKKSLNIWSLGCSTGEEPYTLAILANEAFLKLHCEPRFGITATDISLPALNKARSATYNTRKLMDMKQAHIVQYFSQKDKNIFEVNDDIKQKVCFSMANMVDIEKSPLRNMDVIYCQNVLIYFRKERKHAILDSLVQCLAPGGMLVIGQGEAVEWTHSQVSRVENRQTLAFLRHNNY